MPWKETDKMEQKELFIKAMLANENHSNIYVLISEFPKNGSQVEESFLRTGKSRTV